MTDFSGVNELLIPEWNSGQNGLEQFIFELTAAKSMGVLQPDKSLIYASLVKSQKVSLLSNLNNTQLNNLDNFITYLRDTFGPSLAEQRQSFSDIRQLKDENEILYLERVKKHYASSRQIQVGHFTTWMKEDVKFQFISGLSNAELQRIMMINAQNVEYEDLGTTARNYAVNLKDISKVYEIKSNRHT